MVGRLGELPRHLTAGVGGQRVGIVHGDPESLAGWRLALEAMEPGDPLRFDLAWWTARFLAQGPPGSPGHHAYFGRITGGTDLRLEQVARGGVDLG